MTQDTPFRQHGEGERGHDSPGTAEQRIDGDDTAGRTEPETVDVWADQAPANWSSEPSSDRSLSIGVWERLGDYRRRAE